jgi:putative DNA primase/helicase
MSLACNYDDVMRQLQMRGLVIDKPLLLDSQIQRWKVAGEDRERRGWTRLREWMSKSGAVYIVGAYGIWHGNDDGYSKVEMPAIKPGEKSAPLSDEDKKAIAEANT